MHRATQLERHLFTERLYAEFEKDDEAASDVVLWARRIMRYSATHKRLAEAYCNRELTQAEQRKSDRMEQLILNACAEISPKLVPIFSGDPRGHTVKLKLPSGYTNDFGQTGFCVPTS